MFGRGQYGLGLSPAILRWRPLSVSQDYFDRFSVAPTNVQARRLDAIFRTIKPHGLLSVLDALYINAGQDRQSSKLNLIADAYNLTEIGTVTFDAYRGFTPDGATTYLLSGFNPTTAVSPKFTLTNAHMGGWNLTNNVNGAGNSNDYGNTNSRILKLNTGAVVLRMNNATNVTAGTNAALHKVWNRSASGATQSYLSGVKTADGVFGVTALSNLEFGIGRTDVTAFGVNQSAAFHFGASLTETQVAILYAALNKYLRAVGAVT